ncbi:MAG: ribonuclease BN [Actinomycetota bacterium]|nr:MAG: ribonuclease BN [Actinomycetota bacterium]
MVGRVDTLQRNHAVFGFPYAVVKKYGDDEAGKQAALVTYYGFLSVFPILLLVVTVATRVLVDNVELRQQVIDAVVPADLRDAVNSAVLTLPTSGLPLIIGIVGLLLTGTGVVFSAYDALNHLAGVPHRDRFSFVPRYLRALAMLVVTLIGAFGVGVLSVLAGSLPDIAGAGRIAGLVGAALVVFVVLVLAAKLLVARPVALSAVWPAAALGSVTVALMLVLGGQLLTYLVSRSGPLYGSFATVVGLFSLIYLVSQALMYSAEVALVRRRRAWPRALDASRPTAADLRAYTALAREQERTPGARVSWRYSPAATAAGDDSDTGAKTGSAGGSTGQSGA